MVSLRQIATIKSGYSFRGRIPEATTQGEIEVFQPRDIVDGNLVTSPIQIRHESLGGNYIQQLLKPGQLLLANKGLKFATYIVEPRPLPSLASASFFIIEVDIKQIRPEYLQWYLTQKEALDYLTAHAQKATAISSINKQAVETLLIPLPPLSSQFEICDLLHNVQNEAKLLDQLKLLRKDFVDSHIWQSILISEG